MNLALRDFSSTSLSSGKLKSGCVSASFLGSSPSKSRGTRERISLAVEQPDLDVDGRLTTGQQAIFRVIFGP